MKTPSIFSIKSGAMREHGNGFQHCLISWRSIFAGLIVAMITYMTLMALGLGVAGSSASNMIQGEGMTSGLATGAAVWLGLSVLISLATGSYFAARISTFVTGRVGAAHGLVIAAFFFAFMIYGAGQTIGFAGRGLGSLLGTIDVSGSNLTTNAVLQNVVERALGGVTLKSDPTTVAKEVVNRMLQGNTESARNYLSYQTGLSKPELDARFATMETEFRASLQTVGVRTADAVSRGAWTMFWIMLLGIAASTLSGAGGTITNFKKPLTDEVVPSQFPGRNVAG